MPGHTGVSYILRSPCASLDTIAFPVFPLIQLQEAGALQTPSKGESVRQESKAHRSIRAALLSKAELSTFQLQRPGSNWVTLSGFFSSSSWPVFREHPHPARSLAQRTGVPFSVLSEALPPNSRFRGKRWAHSPAD